MKHFNCYTKKSIIVFFVSVICLSAVAEYLICKCQSMWAYPVLMWMPAVSAGIIGVFVGLLTATGEEIGWRGFLVPALHEKIGLNKTLLITGLLGPFFY